MIDKNRKADRYVNSAFEFWPDDECERDHRSDERAVKIFWNKTRLTHLSSSIEKLEVIESFKAFLLKNTGFLSVSTS